MDTEIYGYLQIQQRFGYMLKKCYNYVMGLLTRNLQVQNKTENKPSPTSSDELNARELEFLLSILKEINFKGANVEVVYSTILKLQNKYIEQTKK